MMGNNIIIWGWLGIISIKFLFFSFFFSFFFFVVSFVAVHTYMAIKSWSGNGGFWLISKEGLIVFQAWVNFGGRIAWIFVQLLYLIMVGRGKERVDVCCYFCFLFLAWRLK